MTDPKVDSPAVEVAGPGAQPRDWLGLIFYSKDKVTEQFLMTEVDTFVTTYVVCKGTEVFRDVVVSAARPQCLGTDEEDKSMSALFSSSHCA